MATALATPPELSVGDPHLLRAVATAVDSALVMCNRAVRRVGVSTVPAHEPGTVTGLIGLHGDVSGFATLNLSERMALSLVGGLLQARFETLSHEIIDGVGELANLVSGGIKGALAGTPWAFRSVTIPSVIVGRNYQIAYAKGIEYLAVTFEQVDAESILLEDRLLQVSVSLMRL